MTLNELGSKLNEMYTNAPKGDYNFTYIYTIRKE